MDKCTRCDGDGLVPGDEVHEGVIVLVNCPECHGLGRIGE